MFYTYKSGAKPVSYHKIDRLKWDNIKQNKRVLNYLSTHHIDIINYHDSHIDYLIEKYRIKGKCEDGTIFDEEILFSVEIWELHHKKGTRIYNERVAEFDVLKQILYEEGFIDIHIIVKIYELSGRQYRDFIISELKRQLKERYGVVELDINIGSISYNRVLRHLRQNLDNRQYKLDKWL